MLHTRLLVPHEFQSVPAHQQLFQPDLRDLVIRDEGLNEWMLEGVDMNDSSLEGNRVRLLIAFLESLTAPDLQARLDWVMPSSVPSGLLEDGIPEID